MPELPEVETVASALNRRLAGRRIVGAEFLGKMRAEFDPDSTMRLLGGKKILSVRRRAKYLVFECRGGVGLLAHLGMTGSFRVEPASAPRRKHDRAVITLDRGDELRYADARRFGFVVPVELPGPGQFPAELDRLGLEPLERAFSAAAMLTRAEGRATPVKAFIMDQTVVVGVGNIYASEALHAAGLDPRRPAGELSRDEWARLVREIKKVLRQAIRRGGSTIRDYRTVTGGEGGFQLLLRVYGRKGEACPRCGAEVRVVRLGGRSTFYCADCQS